MDAVNEREQRELAPLRLQISFVDYSPGIAVFSVSEPCSTVIVAHVRLCFECSCYLLYGPTISQTSVSTKAGVLSLVFELRALREQVGRGVYAVVWKSDFLVFLVRYSFGCLRLFRVREEKDHDAWVIAIRFKTVLESQDPPLTIVG